MCGRYVLHSGVDRLQRLLSLSDPQDRGRNLPARYNIAPTQQVVFAAAVDGARRLLEGRWWLVPHWAKELPKYALFNARSEDAHQKPSFRDAFKTRRCLIPADGYYEWTRAEDGGKDPNYIYPRDREPFAFAGLWAHNEHLDVTSCTILTAAADVAIEHLHHRMPVVLTERAFADWLSADTSVAAARELLTEQRSGELTSRRVSRKVNSSRAEGETLIDPPLDTDNS